ncbi:hypothetical protein FKM82_022322 [Ascaphus truei]
MDPHMLRKLSFSHAIAWMAALQGVGSSGDQKTVMLQIAASARSS